MTLISRGLHQQLKQCLSMSGPLQRCLCGAHENLLMKIPKRLMSNRFRKLERKKWREEKVIKLQEENAGRAKRIYVWGNARTGALGISSYLRTERSGQIVLLQMSRPARLKFLDDERLDTLDVDCGYGFTLFLCKGPKNKFEVYGTGINTDSQLGVIEYPRGRILDYIIRPVPVALPLLYPDTTKIVRVAAGRAHSLVLTDKEGVFSLGNNGYGQCGRRIVEGEIYRGSGIIYNIRDLPDDVRQIVCGQDHSFFITENGDVYSCGLGADGQTGLGHHNLTSQPKLVEGDIKGEKIVQVSSIADCVLAINDKGDVFGWGNSEYQQFTAITSESQLSVPRNLSFTRQCGTIKQVAAAGSKCAILNDKGQVFVWGYGILGKGPNLSTASLPEMIPEPIFGRNEITPDTIVTGIAAGVSHFMAITSNQELYSWGRNNRGCLGLQGDRNQTFPLKVTVSGEPIRVVCGVDHNVAICKSW